MNRKTFIKKTTGALLVALPAYSILSCSNDDSTNGNPDIDPSARDCTANGANAITISRNHGHTLIVPKADIDAGVAKEYSIQGGSGHNHNVNLTADHFAALKANNQITVESTSGSAHRHDVTVACA
ncbi:hypothetical protein [Flagellimonas pacifica]|nr:hypothetical protein [Allomuricauda parva]